MITINSQILPLSPSLSSYILCHSQDLIPPSQRILHIAHLWHSLIFASNGRYNFGVSRCLGCFPLESIRSLWSANKSVTLLVLEINRSNRIRSIDLLPNSLYLIISSPLETFVVASVCVSVVVSASVASCKCVSNDQWWCCLSPSWSLSGWAEFIGK